MKLKIFLFGQLAEQADKSELELENCSSLDEVKNEVRKLIPNLDEQKYAISINQSISREENVSLKDADEIAFLPPFAGG